VESLRSDA